MPESAVEVYKAPVLAPLNVLAGVIDVTEWPRDQDHRVHPYGTKAKRTLRCPSAPLEAGLIPGHAYMFKRAEDWRAPQIWSEAIAYQVASLAGVDVPPCRLAVDRSTGESGALIEFFFGYPDDAAPRRLDHGADLLQGADLMDENGYPHAVDLNITFCRDKGIAEAADWWARTITFDALIGNVDRHSQNWGFLVDPDNRLTMAPTFDNGTSLGYEIAEGAIAERLISAPLASYLAAGKHKSGWSTDPAPTLGHVALCRRLVETYPETRETMVQTVNIDLDAVAAALDSCRALAIEPVFSKAREQLVMALIRARRDRLLETLGS